MALVLSIDLAYKSYNAFGLCLLKESRGRVRDIKYLKHEALGLYGLPDANGFAKNILDFCLQEKISILMLDGPQGWKDPNNGLTHQRICEKCLNTQAKTGVRGLVKPANFTPFVSFSTDVFRLLNNSRLISLVTGERITVASDKILLVETYPYSAWLGLNIKPLDSKRKCSPEQIDSKAEELRRHFVLPDAGRPPGHDELSALVAGLGGVAIAARNTSGYVAVGAPPRLMSDGSIIEGYIVNPSQSSQISRLT